MIMKFFEELKRRNVIKATMAYLVVAWVLIQVLTNILPVFQAPDWVLQTLPTMGAGWCPPGVLGIGIGGTAEKAMLLAKESLMAPIYIDELRERAPSNPIEELRLEIFDKVNALGIGAQGLGGLTTVVDVKILDYPTHAASLPVGMIPNCAATRHIEFHLDGSGPAVLTPLSLEDWPDVTWQAAFAGRSWLWLSRRWVVAVNASLTMSLVGTGTPSARRA